MVYKCDACKKAIKGKMVVAGHSESFLSHHVFCERCGKPVVTFLKQQGFSKEGAATKKPTLTKRKG